jgi:hypothetical protein
MSYYWLAINGGSVAISNMPLKTGEFKVAPTPEHLLGFATLRDARLIQRFLLEAPLPDVTEYMTTGGKCEDLPAPVIVCHPIKPQPPTRGTTVWLSGKEWLTQ